MSLGYVEIENFKSALQAFANGNVCSMECVDSETEEYVAIICGINATEDNEFELVPLARMFIDCPYEEVVPADGKWVKTARELFTEFHFIQSEVEGGEK